MKHANPAQAAGSTAGAALAAKAGAAAAFGAPGGLGALITAMQDGTIFKRVGEVQVGEYTGTGAAQDVALDFDPLFVLVNNLTDGDDFGFAINTANVGTKSQSVVLATAQEATQGILFGAAGTKKFSLGTAATLNETGKVFQFIAVGA